MVAAKPLHGFGHYASALHMAAIGRNVQFQAYTKPVHGYAIAGVIIALRALVSPETICYTPRAGWFRLLPRAVVAELVDAQR